MKALTEVEELQNGKVARFLYNLGTISSYTNPPAFRSTAVPLQTRSVHRTQLRIKVQ
jgi:hypothetical protein